MIYQEAHPTGIVHEHHLLAHEYRHQHQHHPHAGHLERCITPHESSTHNHPQPGLTLHLIKLDLILDMITFESSSLPHTPPVASCHALVHCSPTEDSVYCT